MVTNNNTSETSSNQNPNTINSGPTTAFTITLSFQIDHCEPFKNQLSK